MTRVSLHLRLDQSAAYRIEVQGRSELAWEDFLAGPAQEYRRLEDGTNITIVTGTVADQASLHGLLGRIRDLGLPLLLVEYIT
jgi:hypothetical protein